MKQRITDQTQTGSQHEENKPSSSREEKADHYQSHLPTMAASPRLQLLPALLLAAAALVVASCHAAPQATAGGGLAAEKSHWQDASCLELTQAPCEPTPCTNYCFSIGLNTTGWCTFKGLNVYCCCPVPAAAVTAELPASLSPSGSGLRPA